MPVNQNIYPCNPQVRQLPIYLTGIGGSEYQYHIKRTEGYCWHQLLYSAKGQGSLCYDNVTIPLGEGHFFFLPADYPHEYYPKEGNWDVRWVAFTGFACPQILQELGLTRPVCVRLEDCSPLEKLYNKLFVTQKTDHVHGDFTCSGLMYDYLLAFHKQVLDKGPSGGTDKSSLLMPVLNYIDDNFHKDFPMTVLAELAGVSSQHLCRIFKETLHMRPTEYLTYRRLSEAKTLLRHSELPVAKIGEQIGFPDAGYFSTVFKRYEGVSPAEYRKAIFKHALVHCQRK